VSDITEERPATIRVTGVGSMPGTDPAEAARVVVGELDLPHVPELPARGPGSDMLGRTLALVASITGEFAAETTPTGWRLSGARSGGQVGRHMRRGAAWLAEDVDRLEEQLAGFTGTVKVQVAGPWTLAAGLESVHGTRLVADPGACADLSAAVGEAAAAHLRDLQRRVPGARIALQVDEPSLPAVLAGRIRTASGRGVLRTPDLPEVVGALAGLVAGARAAGMAEVIAHCCAPTVPLEVFARAGFTGAAVDMSVLGSSADEALGAWWDRGGLVMLGAVPSVDPPAAALPLLAETATREVASLWRRIGFPAAQVAARTWLSPGCGLSGASPMWARRAGGVLRSTARMLESAD
jgi:hypothetical protein